MVPLRHAFRNRWWTLAWAAGICWTAAEFARGRGHVDAVDAANQGGTDAQVTAAMNALTLLDGGNGL